MSENTNEVQSFADAPPEDVVGVGAIELNDPPVDIPAEPMTDEEYAEKAAAGELPSDNLNAIDQIVNSVIANAEIPRPDFPTVVLYVTGPADADEGIPAGQIRPALVTKQIGQFECNLAVVLDVDDEPNVAGTRLLARRSVEFDPAQAPGTFHVDD